MYTAPIRHVGYRTGYIMNEKLASLLGEYRGIPTCDFTVAMWGELFSCLTDEQMKKAIAYVRGWGTNGVQNG